MVQKSEKVLMHIPQKSLLKYTDWADVKRISITNCSIYSFLFSSPSNFVAVRFV